MTVRVFRFFTIFFSVFSLALVSIEKIYQTLKTMFATFPNTSKFVKNTPLRVVFLTLFSGFGNVFNHGLSCLTYYFLFIIIANANNCFGIRPV